MSDVSRGVVVDYQGYFLAAVQWDSAGVPPRLNFPRRGERRIRPEDRKTLLTSAEAIADPQPNGRWNASTLVWELPTVKQWVVVQRRDIPRFWTYSGAKTTWPERPPRMPRGSKLIDLPPIDVGISRRPIWDDDAQAWIAPKTVATLDAQGNVTNFVEAYDPAVDVPSDADSVIELDQMPTGENEVGEFWPVDIGDGLSKEPDGSLTVTKKGLPRYRKFPVRFLRQALADANQLANFTAFLTSKGFTIEDFEGVRVVSLRNKLLREFIVAQGFTIKQAYDAIVRVAEEAAATEAQKENTIGEEI